MANLPADLPTNWTQGQIISPNGTEVGLTEQYGYNYLNEQVNNTQTEVNSLSTAQTNTQQQVNTLNTQVGNIQGQVNTQGQSITALQGTTASQGQSITSLQSQVSSNDTDIAELQQTTTTQGQNITTLQGQVSTLNQTTTTQGENITSLQGEVSAINTALDSVAQESSVQDIINSIGSTADTGGSATAGTLMAKMNNMLGNDIPYMILGTDGYTSYYDGSKKNYSTWTTVVDVTGEGYFSGFVLSDGSSGGKLRVTIDNNVYYEQLNTANTGGYTFKGIVNINYILFYGSGTDSYFFDATLGRASRIKPYTEITASETSGVVTGREIPFKNSLKIEVFGSGNMTTRYLYHIKNN